MERLWRTQITSNESLCDGKAQNDFAAECLLLSGEVTESASTRDAPARMKTPERFPTVAAAKMGSIN